MLFSSTLSLASLASLFALTLASPTGLTTSSEAGPPQWCCNCENCENCDASCPNPGCTLFVGGEL